MWENLDGAVSNILTGGATVFDRISLLEDAIYDQASRLFGFIKRKSKNLSGLNRRARYSINLVNEKNILLSQLKNTTSPSEKHSLSSLLENFCARLRAFRRGESSRKRWWKIKQANEAFKKNPFEAGKSVLDPVCNKTLECSQSEVDLFKSTVLLDPNQDAPLPPLDDLPLPPYLSSQLSSFKFNIKDFYQVVNSRRNTSSPGLNMIPYKVYKKCSQISSYLFKIFQSVLRTNNIPIQWRVASEIYIPKVKPPCPSNIADFRPIALLNVEGKLFFSILS